MEEQEEQEGSEEEEEAEEEEETYIEAMTDGLKQDSKKALRFQVVYVLRRVSIVLVAFFLHQYPAF